MVDSDFTSWDSVYHSLLARVESKMFPWFPTEEDILAVYKIGSEESGTRERSAMH